MGDILNNFSKPDVILRNNIDIEYFSNNQLDAYYLIKSANGNPILLMRMALPRDLYLKGNSTIWQFIIILIAIAVISCVILTHFFKENSIIQNYKAKQRSGKNQGKIMPATMS